MFHRIIVFIVCLLATITNAQIVTDGLVLHYDLADESRPGADGVIKDLSGNGIDATVRPIKPPSLKIARTGWLDHHIKQGDGKGGYIYRPAKIQALKAQGWDFTMPFGIVKMDNGELVMACSSGTKGKGAKCTITISSDNGNTWTDFFETDYGGRPMVLSYLGGKRLTLVLGLRYFSNDYGRTWTESVAHPKTTTGQSFHYEGNAWIDRDANGKAVAIHELGWHYTAGKRHPVDDATVVYRRSIDGGKTWIAEVTPPQWKFKMDHKGKTHLRGVSEGAIVRAKNGDLVAALRSDIPPKYFDGPHDDNLEGTAISISKDNGKTWSEMNIFYYAGRHHANLQRLPNGDLVCTLVVRVDCNDTDHTLASYRRGMDALVSRDNGQTWNLDQRYELDAYNFVRNDGYWVDGKCGHIGAVALDDSQFISTYAHYQSGAAILVKWDPTASSKAAAEPDTPTKMSWNPIASAATIFESIAQPGREYIASKDGLKLAGSAWISIPNDDRLLALKQGTIEIIFEPNNTGGMPALISCPSLHREHGASGFYIGLDLRKKTTTQRIFSDQRVLLEKGEYTIQVASPNKPKAFESKPQQLAYTVKDGHGRFYRDGIAFETQTESASSETPGSLFNYTLQKASGNKESIFIAIAGRPSGDGSVIYNLHGRFMAVRIYDRALTPQELNRNRRMAP